jgi:outer membrane protein OmpU
MKKVLLASTALIMSAGYAAADVSVGGDGRMGVIDPFDFVAVEDNPNTPDNEEVLGGTELSFTSRIRISFAASGETDSGLAFGGSIRADNAGGFNIRDSQGNTLGDDSFSTINQPLELTGGGGVLGQAGSVFIEGAFGKLSMGDVDGAAKAAVGNVSGVGLTGLSDLNESIYISSLGGSLPGALYEYSGGDWSVFVSSSDSGTILETSASNIAWALGGSYSFGNFSVALGYEDNDAGTSHIIGGVTGSFGGFTGKFIYGMASSNGDAGEFDGDQWAVSGDYTFGATTLTAYYADATGVDAFGFDENDVLVSSEAGVIAYGIGAAYDLGGGASLVGGWARNDSSGDDAYDFGVSFTF